MEEVIQKAKDLIAQGKLSEAITLLLQNTLEFEDMQNAFSHFAFRLSILKHDKNFGLIAHNDKTLNFNQIADGLLQYISENMDHLLGIAKEVSNIDKAIAASEEKEYQSVLKYFYVSDKGVGQVSEILHAFFNSLDETVFNISQKTKLMMKYVGNTNTLGYQGIINFGGVAGGSLYLRWYGVQSGLTDAKLICELRNAPTFFDADRRIGMRQPKMTKNIEFVPTLDRHLQVKWNSKENIFLSIDQVTEKCLELMLESMLSK